MRIAILGWGSLLWDDESDRGKEFNKHLADKKWHRDGPCLNLEFSRISESRNCALTLVLDYENGRPCQVRYALSNRRCWRDAACDVRTREGTILKRIGCYLPREPDENRWQNALDNTKANIREWARAKGIDVVVWTALGSNFQKKKSEPYSIQAAKRHLKSLDPKGRQIAVQYIVQAPLAVNTPLRNAVQSESWFRKFAGG